MSKSLSVADVCAFLEEFAPLDLAEDWDNVGLIVGDRQDPVAKVMTCLTITEASACEAIEQNVQLIVTHHPLPFKPLKRLTTESTPSKLLWNLMKSRISVYSPHTAFDSAAGGINQQLAEGIGLASIRPLVPGENEMGTGRVGDMPAATSLESLGHSIQSFLNAGFIQYVGAKNLSLQRIAIACGAGGSFLSAAVKQKCDALLTGEARFHDCLEAEAQQVALILPGHYATERFAVENLAKLLGEKFPSLEVFASRKEADPVQLLK